MNFTFSSFFTLQLIGDIIAGTALSPHPHHYRRQFQLHRQLLEGVLLPLHSPNQMMLWRDQEPVLARYHECLVRCLVRLVQWQNRSAAVRDNALGNEEEGAQEGCLGAGESCRRNDSPTTVKMRADLSPWQEEDEEKEPEQEPAERPLYSHPPRPLPVAGRKRSGSVGESEEEESLLVIAVKTLLDSLWPEGFNTNTPKEVLLLHEVGIGMALNTRWLYPLPCFGDVTVCLCMFRQMETLLRLCSAEEFSVVLPPVLVSGKGVDII